MNVSSVRAQINFFDAEHGAEEIQALMVAKGMLAAIAAVWHTALTAANVRLSTIHDLISFESKKLVMSQNKLGEVPDVIERMLAVIIAHDGTLDVPADRNIFGEVCYDIVENCGNLEVDLSSTEGPYLTQAQYNLFQRLVTTYMANGGSWTPNTGVNQRVVLKHYSCVFNAEVRMRMTRDMQLANTAFRGAFDQFNTNHKFDASTSASW